MPVVEMMPPGTASPKACVAWSTSPQVHPPSARTVRLHGVDADALHARQVDDETVIAGAEAGHVVARRRGRQGSSFSRAKFTALMTSATLAVRATGAECGRSSR